MEITPSLIYWISRFDYIQALCMLIGLLGALAFLIPMMFEYCSYNIINTKRLIGSIAMVLIFVASMFIPSTKEMIAIIVIPKLANNEKIVEIGSDLHNVAIKWLKDQYSNSHTK